MIRRKTLLRRSAKPLARSPLRRVSKKRQAENRKYMKLRAEFLASRPWCEACAIIWPDQYRNAYLPHSVEVHHKIDRRAHFLDVASWLAVSREAHAWIHQHPGEARKLGLLK